ncbi:MAG: histidine kinase [Candidatus Dormibacteraeota bacterium]|nr:histidine kinase [Candidatus Dormibacteraeota bacterium]
MNRRLLAVLLTAGMVTLITTFALGAFVYGYGRPEAWRLGLELGVGVSFIGTGIIAWFRRPDNRIGRLLLATGFAWLLGHVALAYVKSPATYTLRWLLSSVYLAILVQILFAFPSGRLSSRRMRFLCLAAYGDAILGSLATLMFLDTRTRALDPNLNLLLLFPDRGLFNLADFLVVSLTIGLTFSILTVFVLRWGRATGPARRIIAPVGWSLALAGLAFIADTVVSRMPALPSWEPVVSAVTLTGAVMLVPIAFLVGLLRSQLARSAVGDLVIELGETTKPSRLREALAHALGDPSLKIAYWLPERQAYVDEAGRPLDLPQTGSSQVVTTLQQEGEPVAALIHDAALAEEPRLVEAVAAAARLAVENERLHADLRARLEEIRASRARIVEAADTERRRLERDLHDGAQQRLVGISLALRLAISRLKRGADPEVDHALDEASRELTEALSELRELARGIHPAILTEEGLGPALESLVERARIPVVLKSIPSGRLPIAVEAAAYFIVSEALANVAKYAQATCATVSATPLGGRIVLEVSDDGIGGADAVRGSGLRGLVDRVSALDGSVRVVSPAGKGTTVHAEIPCVSS